MPGWNSLREHAFTQGGLFHVRDAREREISDQSLYASSEVERVPDFRGVHRFTFAPTTKWFTHTAAFVWSRGEGVISHGSALEVWELSDWMSERITMTLPVSWKSRAIPKRILAFFDTLPPEDIVWFEAMRVTTPRRTVDDFIAWGIRPDLARQAIEQATSRSRPGGALFHRRDLKYRSKLLS